MKGLALVIANFDTRLADLGIQRVGAQATTFDPQIHNAVQQVETDLTPPGCIHRELLPGYVAGGRLLRPASVAVATALRAFPKGKRAPNPPVPQAPPVPTESRAVRRSRNRQG